MKYGKHLLSNIAPEYGSNAYLDYAGLDHVIRLLSAKEPTRVDEKNRKVSLTTPGTNAAPSRVLTEEDFYKIMDQNMAKVEKFTLGQVQELRRKIGQLEKRVSALDTNDLQEVGLLQDATDTMAESFLRLEKYVNINFMGFHKILKKHDKYVPSNPCKTVYITRLHAQAWVRGDYSDVVVRLSSIYASLRNDHVAEANTDPSQSFLRSTSKYWVKTKDVSRVKYEVLKHLPVFLQPGATGNSDAQFTNSVYVDNAPLELYHGRLDKGPGAIALRFRWYGPGDPNVVFVERKTHKDKWMGEVSAKERFMVKEKDVSHILNGTYPITSIKKEMIEKKGMSQQEADDWEKLAREVTQVCTSKQLVPTMRTQCMRTAFQIPFDATVRVSLDTNLCMISERGYDLKHNTVWYRDPSKPLLPSQITRFPHAVLEIKLELGGDSCAPPKWVTDLQSSGLIYEVHKFSKFTHGCAVIMPEDVRAVPYWVDDVTIRDSIIEAGGGRILVPTDEHLSEAQKKKKKKGIFQKLQRHNSGVGPGANQVYQHLLPFGDVKHDRSKDAIGRTAVFYPKKQTKKTTVGNYPVSFYNESDASDDEETTCCDEGTMGGWLFPYCTPANAFYLETDARTSVQKIEPKLFFANERTFMHWLHSGVSLFTIASAILAFSTADEGRVGELGHYYAMALLAVSLGFCMYALRVYLWRLDRIKNRVPGRWDDPRGPILLGGTIATVLIVSFVIKCVQAYNGNLFLNIDV